MILRALFIDTPIALWRKCFPGDPPAPTALPGVERRLAVTHKAAEIAEALMFHTEDDATAVLQEAGRLLGLTSIKSLSEVS